MHTTHSTFRTSTFLLMVDKHTDCKVLLIKGVRNSCDFNHSAATSRTCMSAIHVPVVYGLGGIICNGNFTVVLVTSAGVSFRK